MKIILSTTANIDEAKTIANALIAKKLAACVNIIPQVISVYEWKNSIQNDTEALMIIKTSDEMADLAKEEILKLHSYTLPEIVYLDSTGGHFEYEKWISGQVEN